MKATTSPTSIRARKATRHSTSWAAAELGVSTKTVRRYIASGELGCTTLPGGHYRISEADIRECFERGLVAKHHPRNRAEQPTHAPKPRRPRRRRRAPLGQELPPSPLDLSPAALDALRAQHAAA